MHGQSVPEKCNRLSRAVPRSMHNFVIKEMHQLQYACVKMEEIDAVSEGISSKFKPILIYHSIRKPGYVYELTFYSSDYYQCTHCWRLGKKRLKIVVRQNCVVVSNKHPEDIKIQTVNQ